MYWKTKVVEDMLIEHHYLDLDQINESLHKGRKYRNASCENKSLTSNSA